MLQGVGRGKRSMGTLGRPCVIIHSLLSFPKISLKTTHHNGSLQTQMQPASLEVDPPDRSLVQMEVPSTGNQAGPLQVSISLLPVSTLSSQAAILAPLLNRRWKRQRMVGARGRGRGAGGFPPGLSCWWLLACVFSLLSSFSRAHDFGSG